MPRIRWTPERVEWLRGYAPGHSQREIADEFERVFGVPLTKYQVKNAKQAYGAKSGTHGGRFEKGHAAWNKGKTWDEFMSPEGQERSRATQYKKGDLPHNAHQPIGTERTDRDGYVWVKVAMRKTDPRSAHDNWVCKHRLVYEREHGPIPEGSMVVFLDGDKTNLDPSNLAVETKGEHAVIARWRIPYHDYESHEVARAIARMKSAKHAAKVRSKR